MNNDKWHSTVSIFNSNPDGCKNVPMWPEVIYDSPGDQWKRGRLDVMPNHSRKLLHLERARDGEGSSKTAWCRDYWGGGCPDRGVPRQGVVVQGVNGGK
jgi:hypothetical protein